MLWAVRFLVVSSAALLRQGGAGRSRQWNGQGQPNGTVAAHMDPLMLAEVLALGLNAVTACTQVFTQEHLDIELGLHTIESKLWRIVMKIVPEAEHESDRMSVAKEVWDQSFGNATDITEDIIHFRTTGETESLIKAIRTIMTTAFSSCAMVFQQEAKYFKALGDLIDGIGESWDEFSHGNTKLATLLIWDALRVSVDDVLPQQWSTDGSYMLVMETLDQVISGLSHHVLEYKRQILNSKVCYKQTLPRDRVRPNICRAGFEWDGAALCVPEGNENGADCFSTCGRQAGLCESFCGERKACCRQGFSSDPIECEGAQGFVDHDFAHGTPRDYHQCVSLGPRVVFEISGAGVPAANGLYAESGTHSGRPRYTKVHASKTVVEWSSKRGAWRLFVDDTHFGHGRPTLYISEVDTPSFPTGGWAAQVGMHPAPSVSLYPGDAGADGVDAAGVYASLYQAGDSKGAAARKPYGTHEALCDASSEYSEQGGQWCYKSCPDGFLPSGSSCVQVCGGDFPAEGYADFVCGTDHDELLRATTEMLTMVTSGAMETYVLFNETRGAGVHAAKLTHTINVFIDMGKPFARPECPVTEFLGGTSYLDISTHTA